MTDDHPVVRASDPERDAVVEALRTAVGEGRLTLDEFGDRTGAALAATSKAELDALTADLPKASATSTPPGRKPTWIVGIFGGDDRSGRWRLPAQCRVINILGGCDLDLRAATISDAVSKITVFSFMGGSEIIVPDGVEVELGGFALFGGNDLQISPEPTLPGAPVLRIRAFSFMGGTDIKRS